MAKERAWSAPLMKIRARYNKWWGNKNNRPERRAGITKVLP